MTNIWQQIKEREKERKRSETKPTDALPLLQFLMDEKGKLSQKEKDDIINTIHKSHNEQGKKYVDRAIEEDIMTKQEWKQFKELGFSYADISQILFGVLSKKDGHYKNNERMVLLSTKDSVSYKHRDLVLKKFNVMVLEPKSGLKMLKKIEKKIKNEEEKTQKNLEEEL